MNKSSSNFFSYHLLIYIFFGCYIYYYFTLPVAFSDPDIAWIIPTGQLIRGDFSVPLYDNFSFLSPELKYKWYNASWLWCVFISLLHDWFGVQSLFTFSIIFKASIITFLACLLLKRGVNPHLVLAACFINALVLTHFTGLRPYIATYVLSLSFLYLLQKARKDTKYYYYLPPLMALWVNIHWGFMAGFSIIGCYFIEALINKNKKLMKELIIVSFFSSLALLINPYGVWIIEAFFMHFVHAASSSIIEWQTTKFGTYYGIDLLFAVLLFTSNYKNKNIALHEKIITGFWVIQSLSTMRNAMLLAGLGAYFICKNLELYAPKKVLDKYKNMKYNPIIAPVLLVLILISIIIPVNVQFRNLVTKPDEKITQSDLLYKKSTPKKAIEFIIENYPDKRVFNHYDYGSFITYFSAGRVKNFADSRFVTAFPASVTKFVIEFYALESASIEKQFYDAIKKYEVEMLFFPNEYFRLIPSLDKYWKKVYSDEIASVYILK